jgi:hypothetical protein
MASSNPNTRPNHHARPRQSFEAAEKMQEKEGMAAETCGGMGDGGIGGSVGSDWKLRFDARSQGCIALGMRTVEPAQGTYYFVGGDRDTRNCLGERLSPQLVAASLR